MKYVSGSHLRPLYKDTRLLIVLVLTMIVFLGITHDEAITAIALIAVAVLWIFLVPSHDDEYELTAKGISIKQEKKTIEIPYHDVERAIFRSFRTMPSGYMKSLRLRTYSLAYNAITLRYNAKSIELRFDKNDEKEAASFFTQIKKHIGDRATDWRKGDMDWSKVALYFMLTWVLILVFCVMVDPGYLFAAFFIMPLWGPVWFLILHTVGVFNKEAE